jgi:hypothetical protein
MLTDSQVRELYESRAAQKDRHRQGAAGGYAIVRDPKNGLVRESLASKSSDYVGAHQGNVGSIRRSRKGASRRMANGRRFYVAGSPEVVAYKV